MEKPFKIVTRNPIVTAVIRTPKVERAIPCQSIGLISVHLVSIPPENRIKLKATEPMKWAIFGSEKAIPPSPSEPASIPTRRKSRRVGIPYLVVLLASKLKKSSMDQISRILSNVRFMRLAFVDFKFTYFHDISD